MLYHSLQRRDIESLVFWPKLVVTWKRVLSPSKFSLTIGRKGMLIQHLQRSCQTTYCPTWCYRHRDEKGLFPGPWTDTLQSPKYSYLALKYVFTLICEYKFQITGSRVWWIQCKLCLLYSHSLFPLCDFFGSLFQDSASSDLLFSLRKQGVSNFLCKISFL